MKELIPRWVWPVAIREPPGGGGGRNGQSVPETHGGERHCLKITGDKVLLHKERKKTAGKAGPGARTGNLCLYTKHRIIKNYEREKTRRSFREKDVPGLRSQS